MTRRQFAAMVLKLLGVFAVIQALPLLQNVGLYFALLAGRTIWVAGVVAVFGSVVPFLLMAGAGVFLLLKSRWLARRLFREDSALGLGTGLGAGDVQAVLFSAVGVLLFLDAVPRLLQIIASVSAPMSSTLGATVGPQYVRGVSISALGMATRAGLGLALFFRARGLSNLWHRLQAGRYVRVEAARDDETAPEDRGTGG